MVHKLELRREHSTRRPRPIPDSSQWSAIVSDPKSLSSAELMSLCLALNLIFSRPKDVLILELMKSMSLKHPTPTPARLVLAVQCERRDHLHDVDQKDKLSDSLRRAKGEGLGKQVSHSILAVVHGEDKKSWNQIWVMSMSHASIPTIWDTDDAPSTGLNVQKVKGNETSFSPWNLEKREETIQPLHYANLQWTCAKTNRRWWRN